MSPEGSVEGVVVRMPAVGHSLKADQDGFSLLLLLQVFFLMLKTVERIRKLALVCNAEVTSVLEEKCERNNGSQPLARRELGSAGDESDIEN